MAELLLHHSAEMRATLLEFGFWRYVVGQVIEVGGEHIKVHEADLTTELAQITVLERSRADFPSEPPINVGSRFMITTYFDDYVQPSGHPIRDVVSEFTLFGGEFDEANALHSTFT